MLLLLCQDPRKLLAPSPNLCWFGGQECGLGLSPGPSVCRFSGGLSRGLLIARWVRQSLPFSVPGSPGSPQCHGGHLPEAQESQKLGGLVCVCTWGFS